jgi:hypothetical protein
MYVIVKESANASRQYFFDIDGMTGTPIWKNAIDEAAHYESKETAKEAFESLQGTTSDRLLLIES